MRIICLGVFLCLIAFKPLFAQEVREGYIHANGINFHYLDFGGKGLPLIFIQSFHDDASEWYTGEMEGVASQFTPEYRVLAITRRGWGKSDYTEWGYDVASQSEDLLAVMDALGIDEAVLIGRIPANQDMLWIAEHHPERMAAMIMIGNPYLSLNSSEPEIQKYETKLLAMSWDLDKHAIGMRGPRNSWRPHFLADSSRKIEIPTLRFLSKMDLESLPGGRNAFYLDRTIQKVSSEDFEPWNEQVALAAEYFRDLGKDSIRKEFIWDYLIRHDPGPAFREGMQQALGNFLQTVWEPEIPEGAEFDMFWREVYAPFFVREIKDFLNETLE